MREGGREGKFHAFTGPGAPHWDPPRAALESECYQTLDPLTAMVANSTDFQAFVLKLARDGDYREAVTRRLKAGL